MKRWKVALLGECMVEVQESPKGCSLKFGGDTLNTAVYMARLGRPFGVEVYYVTAMGDDALSERMMEFWESEGVCSDLVRRLPGKLPGLYYINLRPDGERVFSYWRGEAAARDCFEAAEGDSILERLENFDCIYCSGVSLAILRENGRDKLLSRLADLAAGGKRIAFDGNYRPRLWGDTPEKALAAASSIYKEMIAASHTVLLTREELAVLGINADASRDDWGYAFASLYPKEFVVKDGKEACFIWHDGIHSSITPDAKAPVVDTTAAGDSFAAAYLIGRHLGLLPTEAASEANALAEAVIAHHGAIIAREEMPTLFGGELEPVDFETLHPAWPRK